MFSSPLLILNGSPWPKWGWMCELKRIHWSELSLSTRAKETGRAEFKEGLAVARFRYTIVKNLQDTVVGSCVQCVGWQRRQGGGQGACIYCTDLPASLCESSLIISLLFDFFSLFLSLAHMKLKPNEDFCVSFVVVTAHQWNGKKKALFLSDSKSKFLIQLQMNSNTSKITPLQWCPDMQD